MRSCIRLFFNQLALVVVIGAATVSLSSSAIAVEQVGQPKVVYKTIDKRYLAIDFHYPSGWKAADKRPIVVFFFGGGWTHGTPEQFRPQAEYFAKRGLVCGRADYRIKAKDGVAPDKCVEDAIDAIRWVRTHAAELGADPDRIVAAGGSAGGHLAACTFFADGNGSDDANTVSAKPNALILYNPVLDLVDFKGNEAQSKVAAPFMRGLSVEVRERISPLRHLRKETPPTLVLDGTKDWLVTQTREFVDKSKSLGAPVEVYFAEGQPHGFFNKDPWLGKTTKAADEFLCRLGYLGAEPKVELPSRGDKKSAPAGKRRGGGKNQSAEDE